MVTEIKIRPEVIYYRVEKASEEVLKAISGLDADLERYAPLNSNSINWLDHGDTLKSVEITGKIKDKRIRITLPERRGRSHQIMALSKPKKGNPEFICTGLDDFVRACMEDREYLAPQLWLVPFPEPDCVSSCKAMGFYPYLNTSSPLTIRRVLHVIDMLRQRYGFKEASATLTIPSPLGILLEYPLPKPFRDIRFIGYRQSCIPYELTDKVIGDLRECLNLDESYVAHLSQSDQSIYYRSDKESFTHIVLPNPMFFDKQQADSEDEATCCCGYSVRCGFARQNTEGNERIDLIASSNPSGPGTMIDMDNVYGVYEINSFLLVTRHKLRRMEILQASSLTENSINIGDYKFLSITRR